MQFAVFRLHCVRHAERVQPKADRCTIERFGSAALRELMLHAYAAPDACSRLSPTAFEAGPQVALVALMIARLDHITVVAPSLEAGAAYVEAVLGVMPGAGRSHPGMATHNLLLALGPDVYLEVIAADPGAIPVRPRWFGLDHVLPGSAARLAAWVARTDDITVVAVPELGGVETMRREHHTWKMTARSDGSLPLDGAAPLLIQRASGVNPAAALPPSGLLLQGLRIWHPAPSQVLALFAKIGLATQPSVTVAKGDECHLVAEIQTPFGIRKLGEI